MEVTNTNFSAGSCPIMHNHTITMAKANLELFQERPKKFYYDVQKPLLTYQGELSCDKNFVMRNNNFCAQVFDEFAQSYYSLPEIAFEGAYDSGLALLRELEKVESEMLDDLCVKFSQLYMTNSLNFVESMNNMMKYCLTKINNNEWTNIIYPFPRFEEYMENFLIFTKLMHYYEEPSIVDGDDEYTCKDDCCDGRTIVTYYYSSFDIIRIHRGIEIEIEFHDFWIDSSDRQNFKNLDMCEKYISRTNPYDVDESLFLVLSGDIETNPGPTSYSKPMSQGFIGDFINSSMASIVSTAFKQLEIDDLISNANSVVLDAKELTSKFKSTNTKIETAVDTTSFVAQFILSLVTLVKNGFDVVNICIEMSKLLIGSGLFKQKVMSTFEKVLMIVLETQFDRPVAQSGGVELDNPLHSITDFFAKFEFEKHMAPVCRVAGCICVLILTLINSSIPTTNTIVSFMKNFVNIGNFCKAANNIWEFLIKATDFGIKSMYDMITGNYNPEAPEEFLPGIGPWMEEVARFSKHDITDNLANDLVSCHKIEDLYFQGLHYYKTLKDLEGVSKLFGPKVLASLDKHWAIIKMLYERVDRSGCASRKQRVEPIVIRIFGAPGVGKSFLTKLLCCDLAAHSGRGSENDSWDSHVYNRCVQDTSDFWNGYRQQLIVVYDDFDQCVDSQTKQNKEYMEVIRVKNCTPFDTAQAALEDKGKWPFTSRIVILTTNVKNHKPKSIKFENALTRRFDINIECNVNKKYAIKVGDDWMVDKTKVDQSVEIDENVYEFSINYEPANQSRITVHNQSFAQLIDIIKDKYDTYHEKSMNTKNQLKNRYLTKLNRPTAQGDEVEAEEQQEEFFDSVLTSAFKEMPQYQKWFDYMESDSPDPETFFCVDALDDRNSEIVRNQIRDVKYNYCTKVIFGEEDQKVYLESTFYKFAPYIKLIQEKKRSTFFEVVDECYRKLVTSPYLAFGLCVPAILTGMKLVYNYVKPVKQEVEVKCQIKSVAKKFKFDEGYYTKVSKFIDLCPCLRCYKFIWWIEDLPLSLSVKDDEIFDYFTEEGTLPMYVLDWITYLYFIRFNYLPAHVAFKKIESFKNFCPKYKPTHVTGCDCVDLCEEMEESIEILQSDCDEVPCAENYNPQMTIKPKKATAENYHPEVTIKPKKAKAENYQPELTIKPRIARAENAVMLRKERIIPSDKRRGNEVIFNEEIYTNMVLPESTTEKPIKTALTDYMHEGDFDKYNIVSCRNEEIVKVEEKPIAQSLTDQNADEIISYQLAKNLYKFNVYTNKGFSTIHVLFIKGRIAIAPKHQSWELRKGNYGVLVNPFFPNGMEIRNQDLVILDPSEMDYAGIDFQEREKLNLMRRKDLMIIAFPEYVYCHVDISSKFVCKEDLAHLQRNDATLLCIRSYGDKKRVVGAYAHFNIQNVESKDQVFRYYTMDDVEIKIRNYYEYFAETKPGDCGAPLIVCNKSLPRKIYGMHVAAFNKNGMAISITQDDLKLLIPQVKGVAQVGMVFPEQFIATPIEQLVPNTAPHGIVSKAPGGARETSIRPSLIHGAMTEPITKPAYLRTKYGINPMIKGIQNVGITAPLQNKEHLMIAKNDVLNVLRQRVPPHFRKVLSFEESVMGIPGEECLGPMNRRSSPGFPWVLNRTGVGKTQWLGDGDYVFDPEVKDRCNQRIQLAKKNIRDVCFWIDTLKDERRPIEKVEQMKTRVFAAGEMTYVIVCRQYFLGFAANIMENRIKNECAIGTNPYSIDWTKLYFHLQSKGEKVIAGDFSRYDTSISAELLWTVCDIINEWYGDDNAQIRKVLFEEVVNSFHICEGKVYQWHKSEPSGFMLTAVLNCIVNMLLIRLCWLRATEGTEFYSMEQFHDNVSFICYGDDNAANISDRVISFFNQNEITKHMEAIGMVYTDENKTGVVTPYRSIDQIDFLKRGFLYNIDMRFCAAPLKWEVCLEMMNWIRDKDPEEVATNCNILNAMREIAMHGEERYNEVKKDLEKICVGFYTPPSIPSFYEFSSFFLQQRGGQHSPPGSTNMEDSTPFMGDLCA